MMANNMLSLTFYPKFVASAVFVDKDKNSNEEHATEPGQQHGNRHLQKKQGRVKLSKKNRTQILKKMSSRKMKEPSCCHTEWYHMYQIWISVTF